MVDDFHGTQGMVDFDADIQRVFPDKPVVDIPNDNAIFHTVYDLDDHYQVPGERFVYAPDNTSRTVTTRTGGISDDKGRLMVAICHDMDLGDSWEHAANPEYRSNTRLWGCD